MSTRTAKSVPAPKRRLAAIGAACALMLAGIGLVAAMGRRRRG